MRDKHLPAIFVQRLLLTMYGNLYSRQHSDLEPRSRRKIKLRKRLRVVPQNGLWVQSSSSDLLIMSKLCRLVRRNKKNGLFRMILPSRS